MVLDILLLFAVRPEALSDITSASKFYPRLCRSIAAVNTILVVDSSFLQNLSVDLWAMAQFMVFFQTFSETLGTKVGLAMLGLLWTLDTDPDLHFEEPFLWVQKWKKHTQTCEPRLLEMFHCRDWGVDFPGQILNKLIGVILLRQTDLSLLFPLSDTISWWWLTIFSIHWDTWIHCLPLHSLTLVSIPFTGIPGFTVCLYIH